MASTNELQNNPQIQTKNKTSVSETGHAKNVANLETLISFCKGYGAKYVPTNTRITTTQLTSLLTTAQTKIQNVHNTKTAFTLATDERQKEFENLKKLATKIMNALGASGINPQIIEDAKTINTKLQGTSTRKKSAKSTSTPPSENLGDASSSTITSPPSEDLGGISTSQQSYDRLIDHFTALIQLLTQNPTYNPNEIELKVVTLNAKLTALKTKNTNLKNANTNYSNAQIDRDKTLYDPTTGLVQTAKEVKQYVKSVFGATAPEYKQISGVEFKEIKKD